MSPSACPCGVLLLLLPVFLKSPEPRQEARQSWGYDFSPVPASDSFPLSPERKLLGQGATISIHSDGTTTPTQAPGGWFPEQSAKERAVEAARRCAHGAPSISSCTPVGLPRGERGDRGPAPGRPRGSRCDGLGGDRPCFSSCPRRGDSPGEPPDLRTPRSGAPLGSW